MSILMNNSQVIWPHK